MVLANVREIDQERSRVGTHDKDVLAMKISVNDGHVVRVEEIALQDVRRATHLAPRLAHRNRPGILCDFDRGMLAEYGEIAFELRGIIQTSESHLILVPESLALQFGRG